MRKFTRLLLLAPLLLTAAACELTKTENPLSPSVAGPIPGVDISAPKLLEPLSGQQIAGDKQPIILLIENAWSTGQRPLSLLVEVATDAGFANLVFSRDAVALGEGGRTALTLPTPLGTGRAYYWRAQARDGANSGPYSPTMGFNVFTPVSFDKPAPRSPAGNVKVSTLTPEFVFDNAPRAGNPGLVTYVIEVATNSAFAGIIAAWQFPEQSSQTRFVAPSGLPVSSQLFWHVRAYESTALGPWSDTASFVTPTPTPTTPPPTTGSGGGSACTNETQIGIVTCRREQFKGHMDSSQIIVFLKGVAGDLNKAGTWGSGWGLLRKASGTRCIAPNGVDYSCDVICKANGPHIYDVLSDVEGAQTPTWGELGPPASTCDVY